MDLDGTLIKSDLLWEALVRLVKRNPAQVLLLPFWLAKGLANFKRQIARRAPVDVALLPYRAELVSRLTEMKAAGRPLVLATATDSEQAKQVAAHAGLFTEVMGSDGRTNLRGAAKAEALVKRYGERGFDYAGDSTRDLPVWQRARSAIVVATPGGSLEKAAGKVSNIVLTLPSGPPKWQAALKAMRPYQWCKNLIIFVPLLASHRFTQLPLLMRSIDGFVAFCAAASAVYVANDLLDLDSDRRHAIKCRRGFASGDLPISWGLVMAPGLIVAAFAVALTVGAEFQMLLLVYLLLSSAYSHWAKQVPLLDVFILTTLYTMRLIAGHSVTGILLSNWLFIFSLFIFLSLALAKRYVEVTGSPAGLATVHGRGYKPGDSSLLAELGIGNGLMSVLVLALYAKSPEAALLYLHPGRLLLICPLFMYWISRVWLLAHRGQLHEDPVVFTLRDKVSYLLAVLALGIFWFASSHRLLP